MHVVYTEKKTQKMRVERLEAADVALEHGEALVQQPLLLEDGLDERGDLALLLGVQLGVRGRGHEEGLDVQLGAAAHRRVDYAFLVIGFLGFFGQL